MPKKLIVRYLPIQITKCFVNGNTKFPDNLMMQRPLVIDQPGDIATLYRCLNTVNKRAPFSVADACLFVEPTEGIPLYGLDGQGNVRRGSRDEYQITPRAFFDPEATAGVNFRGA